MSASAEFPVVNAAEITANNELAATNNAIALGEVPTMESLSELGKAADGITETTPGIFQDAQGNTLENETAQTFKKNADPATWMLDEAAEAEDNEIFEASSLSELEDETIDLILMNKQPYETEKQLFERVQATAEKRLVLSAQLKEAKAEADAKQAVVDERNAKLLGIDENGRMRIAAGNSTGGQFLTKEQQGMVLEHAEQIQKGLPELIKDVATVDANGRVHREDGRMANADEIIDIANNQKQRRADKAETTAAALPLPEGFTQEQWDKLPAAQKTAISELIAEQAEKEAADLVAAAEAAEANPATATTESRRARAKKRLHAAFTNLQLGSGKEKRAWTEKDTRRAKIIGGVAGAVALTGVFVAATKGAHIGGSGNTLNAQDIVPPTKGGEHGLVGHVTGAVHEATAAAAAAGEVHAKVSEHLPKGGTVWGLAKERLGGHPTNAQVFEKTQSILKLNGMSWEDARHLAVGTEIKMS